MLRKSTISSKFAGIISASVLILLTAFTSCDNFVNGSLIKEEIQKQIEYAKAEEVNIMIAPSDSSHGTTYPNITKTYKVTDTISVRFKEADSYSFVKWIAKDVSNDEEVADIVEFENPEELETKVTVIGNGKDIQICPVVVARPNVSDFYPKTTEKGEPRDSSIVITFNKDLAEDNDFSQIQISCAGLDVSSCFTTPVLNGNILTIAADETNLISVEAGKTKTVTVTLPEDLYYEENNSTVTLNSNVKYTYKINDTTNSKAVITVSVDADKGTVSPATTASYNIGDEIELSFTPKDGYNFYYWNILDGNGDAVSDDVLYVEDKNALKTKVKVLAKAEGININPKSMLLLNISDWSPKMSDEGEPRDSSITVTFNNDISEDNDFSKIKITCDGNDVTGNYKTPVLNGNILTIAADKANLLSVSKNQTKTITVTIPSDFYYVSDGENIPMGSKTTFSYLINETTNDKAVVTASVATEKGTVTLSGSGTYNIGETFTVTFTPAADYNFTGWNILDGEGKEVDESILYVEDNLAYSANITVRAAVNGVSITPKSELVPKIVVSECSPKFTTTGVSCDKSLQIVFNTPMNKEDLESFQNISIRKTGNAAISFNDYYNTPILSDDGKKLTIVPKSESIEEMFGGDVSKDIGVYLSNKVRTADNRKLSNYYEAEVTLMEIRITSIRDNEKPVVTSLVVKRHVEPQSNIQPTEFQKGTFEQILKSVGKDNFFKIDNVVKSLDIEFAVSDSDSGIAGIKVVERLLYDVDGNKIKDGKKERIIPLTSYITDYNNASGNYTYEFDPLLSNGITEVEISFIDNSGNESLSYTYSLIKKTCFYNIDMYIRMGIENFHNWNGAEGLPDPSTMSMAEKIETDKYLGMYYMNDDKFATYDYVSYYDQLTDFSINVDLLNANDVVLETINNPYKVLSDPRESYYLYKFNQTKNNEKTTYRATVKDSVGNTEVVKYEVYPTPELLNVTYKENITFNGETKNYYYLDFSQSPNEDWSNNSCIAITWSNNQDFSSSTKYSASSDWDGSPNNGYSLPVTDSNQTVYLYINYENGDGFCNYSNIYTITPSMVVKEGSDSLMVPEFEYKYCSDGIKNSENNILKVSFSEQNFAKYDKVLVNLMEKNEDDTPIYSKLFDSNTSYSSVDAKVYKSIKFTVTGIKDNNCYTSGIKEVSISTESGDYGSPVIYSSKLDIYGNAIKLDVLDYPDKNIDNLKDANGNIKLKVADLGTNFASRDIYGLTEEKMKSLSYEEYSLKPVKEGTVYYLYFPLSKYHLTYDEYVSNGKNSNKFCFYLEDKNGNYTYKTFSSEFYYEKQNHYAYYDSTGKLTKFVRDGGFKNINYIRGENWINTDFVSTTSANLAAATSSFSYIKFISGISERTYDRPLYCASQKYDCGIKDFSITKQQGKDYMKLFIDHPVFVHRLVCTENFGDNIDEWERWTLQSNKQHEMVLDKTDSLLTQQYFETASIPEGYYYCYVVYYSDNTYQMSSVYQK